jgi:hypothetical protein
MEKVVKESLALQPTLNPGRVNDMEKSLAAAIRTEMVVFQTGGERGRL